MRNPGFILTTLSLIYVIYSDFKYRKIYNLSLVTFVVGLAIFMPSSNLAASIIRVVSAGVVLVILNLSLREKSKTPIQPGDVKLILILAWFLSVQSLSLILVGASLTGLILALTLKLKRLPLGGMISVAVIIFLILASP